LNKSNIINDYNGGGYILEIIKITIEDLVDVVNLYKNAIKKMEENNIFQWDEIYPDEDILKDDVIKGQMYGIKMNNEMSLFQNPVGFEPGSRKNRQKPGFSTHFKEAVPKTEVFEQPQIVCVFVINNEFDEAYLNGKWEYNQDNYKVIHRICVKSNYQNKGIGTKAMIKKAENLKNNNTGSIRLDAFSKNPYSLKMYNKLGYRKVGEANWRKGLFYLLEKIL
jgi:ribosomal protein S18 acetylase RimI-like enzyme